jgi:apolipoprotein N-acyltransferase
MSELSPRRRLWGTLIAFLLLYVAGPGIVTPDGLWFLAPPALGLWAFVASRPGRHAFWMEAMGAAVGWTLILSWAGHVFWALLVWIGPGMGLYMAAQGWCLRRFAQRVPLALAAPAAWILSETVRASLEPPFGFQWMRLGTHLHAVDWIAGSARVWGIGGLSFVLTAFGGWLAELVTKRSVASFVLGLGPTLLGVAFTFLVRPPEMEPGPSVLLVQPGIAQERKMNAPDPYELYAGSVELMLSGLDPDAPPDLVAWGETMLHTPIAAPDLLEAVRAGARPAPWFNGGELPETWIQIWEQQQKAWVDYPFFGHPDAGPDVPHHLPEGTAFVCGAEHFTVRDGVVGRQNAVFLWEGVGPPAGPVGKLHLVPSGETMMGLERFALVRRAVMAMAGYVPDLLPAGDGARTLAFTARDGRRYHLGVSICFDNAFSDPYSLPLRIGPVDFHFVASNEAWFKFSQEPDQMVAFSRLEALATARSVVRATNSGISIVLGPEGSEIERLVVDGRDREVAGTLAAVVPVPVAGAAGDRTPWVRWGRIWAWLFILGPLALFLIRPRRVGNPPAPVG